MHIHRVFCVVEVYSSESISHQLPILETHTQHSTPSPTVATFPNRQYLVAVLLTKRTPHSPMQKALPLPPANHGSGPPASHDPPCLCLQRWGGPAGNVRRGCAMTTTSTTLTNYGPIYRTTLTLRSLRLCSFRCRRARQTAPGGCVQACL